MLDTLGVQHKGPKHKVVYEVIKGLSVFGTVHVNAMLRCHSCRVTAGPHVFNKSEMKQTGVHRLRFWIEKDEVVK